MEYACVYHLLPDEEQKKQIERNFGCARKVFNFCLQCCIDAYEAKQKFPNRYQLDKKVTDLKKELTYLKEADSTSLQVAVKNLAQAFENFFNGIKNGRKVGFPKFKSKKGSRQSYTSKCVNGNIKVFKDEIQLPKLGRVKCRVSREVKGRILSATVSRRSTGKYYVSVNCTDVEMDPLPKTGLEVGIDLGIKSFAVTSDGKKYPNPKFGYKQLKKVVRLQRSLSRKPKDSKRREKDRQKLARALEHIANQRLDRLQKLSTEFVRTYDLIAVEDLAIPNMVKNHRLAFAISDAGWGMFCRMLEYKAEWYGKRFVKIGRFVPSSQTCSNCGEKWSGTKDLSVREWTCPHCGAVHDRDINAAKNILKEGKMSLRD